MNSSNKYRTTPKRGIKFSRTYITGASIIGLGVCVALLIYTGKSKSQPTESRQQVEQRLEQKVTKTEQSRYQLPADFGKIINISSVSNWHERDVTYESVNGEIKTQYYYPDGTTHTLPITWRKPGAR